MMLGEAFRGRERCRVNAEEEPYVAIVTVW
jgi:hypothetical protein